MLKKMKSGLKYVTQKKYRFQYNACKGYYDSLTDAEYLSKLYESKFGKKLNLENPKTFNEKLQWLKLNDRKPEYTIMVDKHSVKKYVEKKIGKQYVIPSLGVWNNFSEIDFESLPQQFVLKTTHGCGGMAICRNKQQFKIDKIRNNFKKSLKQNYYYHVREWPYKDVPPRILAEPFMKDDKSDVLIVYKVFNFNGVPRIIQVIQGDKTKYESIDYFDIEWNLLEMHQNYPNSKVHLSRPKVLGEMLMLSRGCSEGFPFLRTDWYIVNGQIYFSEFTFYSDAGMAPFHPADWDLVLGKWIKLPIEELKL